MSKPTRYQSLSTTRRGPRFPTIDMYNFYTHPVRVIQSTGLTSSTHPGHIFLSDNHPYPLPTSPNTNTNFLATLRWYLQYKLVIPRNVYLFWPPEIKYSDFKGLNFGGSIHVSTILSYLNPFKQTKIFKLSPHEKILFLGGWPNKVFWSTLPQFLVGNPFSNPFWNLKPSKLFELEAGAT